MSTYTIHFCRYGLIELEAESQDAAREAWGKMTADRNLDAHLGDRHDDYQLISVVVSDELAPQSPITAEAHSDDRVLEADFDAAPWFKTASDGEIVALRKEGWGTSFEADQVAQSCDSQPGLAKLFAYLALSPRMGKDVVGFECTVDEDSAESWLRANRPAIAMRLRAV